MSDVNQAAWESEAQDRWGNTEAFKESTRRARKYGKEEWAQIKEQQDGVEAALADAMTSGEPAEGPRAVALAEEARLLIDRWFYPCSHRMHVGLAEMYTADPRFRAHYDERAEGLAEYLASAIRANAELHEAS